jgi:hypothetical protein
MMLLTNKCPHCHHGNVFQNPNLFTYNKDIMNKGCPVCHEAFEKEPGFYWGAMYASYGLGVAEAFITYFICRLFGTGTFDWLNLYLIVIVLLLLSPFNFRMARLIWLYLFS